MSDRDEHGRFLPEHALPGPGARGKFEDWMPAQARRLALLGLTDAQIAEAFAVTHQTLINWQNGNVAFFEALNAGRVLADAHVAEGLFKRAVGMTIYEDRLAYQDGKQIVTKVAKQIPPDPGAAAMWLGSRQRKLWSREASTLPVDTGNNLEKPLADLSDDELKRKIEEIEARRRAADAPH